MDVKDAPGHTDLMITSEAIEAVMDADTLMRLTLSDTISAWVEIEIEAGESVPDFWDELDTSARLAEFLVANGWTKPV